VTCIKLVPKKRKFKRDMHRSTTRLANETGHSEPDETTPYMRINVVEFPLGIGNATAVDCPRERGWGHFEEYDDFNWAVEMAG